jgi:radical SAM superfamily enzyme YgiQ (UPF0313 family)
MTNRISCISIDIINADKPPASLAFLAGACEQAGREYHAISLNSVFIDRFDQHTYNQIYSDIKIGNLEKFDDLIGPVLDSVIDQMIDFGSDCLLISVFSYLQLTLAEKFLRRLQGSLWQGVVVAGGPGITYQESGRPTNGRILAALDLVDLYCLGEGDRVLTEYLISGHVGLGLNRKSDAWENWVPQLNDLDQAYVMPSYKKVNVVAYKNLESKSSPVFSLSGSRGCVRRCTFCDVAKTWPKFRFRSGKSLAKEVLKHHHDVGAVHFTLVDSLINGSIKSFREFNEEMVRLKDQNHSLIRFSYNGMFIVRNKHSHPEELFALMAQAGCESLAIGVETGSDRLRFEMDKKFTNDDLEYHLEMTQKYHIKNFFLTFVAYPTETRQDFEQTLQMLDRFQKYLIDGTIGGINHSGIFGMLADTPVYDAMDEIGIMLHPDSGNKLNWHNVHNPDLTVKERIIRDLTFRKRALDLRYPMPYAERYLEYLNQHDMKSVLLPD